MLLSKDNSYMAITSAQTNPDRMSGRTNQSAPKTEPKVSLPQYLNKAQLDIINQKTPTQFVKTRPGPGGSQVKYVEVGYVINLLNQIFGWNWDFKVIDQQIGSRQVWVRGELTVKNKGQVITKGQYGGADIKFNKSGNPVSIADDLKTAASDSLKKCASMIGVAGDIYWQDLENWNLENLDQDSENLTNSF